MFDNVSDTPKEQFHERGQALSPKSIPLDIASTPRSYRYCVICKRDGSRGNPSDSVYTDIYSNWHHLYSVFSTQKP